MMVNLPFQDGGDIMANLLWLQSGCCCGSTISFLNAEQPDILTALEILDARFVWHPDLRRVRGGKKY